MKTNTDNGIPSWIVTTLAILFISSLFVTACQHTIVDWKGSTAKQEDNRAILTGGPHDMSWKTHYLDVNFTYTLQEETFSIEGTVDVTRPIENGFKTLHQFSVFMNLLDESKLVLDSQAIVIAGPTPIRTFRFEREMPLPHDATLLNFSYSGTAAEGGNASAGGGEDGGGSVIFWQNP